LVEQGDLFGDVRPQLPAGFRYEPDLVPQNVQEDLLQVIPALDMKPFDFHGYEGKRRVISYGWRYDYQENRVRKAEDVPDFLHPVREIASAFAGIRPEQLPQALVTEYEPGAPIGWHRDKGAFGRVIGISLLSSCTFRLRRRVGDKWERASIRAEPGSIYILSGPSRSEWEHSIPPVEELRYSITFRELAS
jgi:alkylated DNA repair dioxygenase AlkB